MLANNRTVQSLLYTYLLEIVFLLIQSLKVLKAPIVKDNFYKFFNLQNINVLLLSLLITRVNNFAMSIKLFLV